MSAARRAALAGIAILVAVASLTSFAESYRGLYAWSREHGLNGGWAVAWPLQVDVFIAVGELALFVAMADQWTRRNRAGAWAVTLAGLAVSVAGNVGHVGVHAVTSRATAAVPPLAAAAALAVGLGVLKRVIAASAPVPAPVPARTPVPGPQVHPVPAESNGHEPAARLFAAAIAAGEVPSIRRIREQMHCGQPRAREIQRSLEALTPAGKSIAQIRAQLRDGGDA